MSSDGGAVADVETIRAARASLELIGEGALATIAAYIEKRLA